MKSQNSTPDLNYLNHDVELPPEHSDALPIPGHPGYFAAPAGYILSFRQRGYKCLADHPKVLIPSISRGYGAVSLDGKKVPIHVLILTVFIGPRPLNAHCCHADGNRTNNAVDNLRWGTAAENGRDRVRHGTSAKGSKHPFAILSEADVLFIVKKRKAGFTQKSLAEKFGVNPATISDINRGATWSHITGILHAPRYVRGHLS